MISKTHFSGAAAWAALTPELQAEVGAVALGAAAAAWVADTCQEPAAVRAAVWGLGAALDGDARAVLRNPGAARKREPVVYPSSRAYLDAALQRIREKQAVWERSEMGRRMAAIAVPPATET